MREPVAACALALMLSAIAMRAARATGPIEQNVSPAQLEAAFIMNVVRFTEWSAPDDISLVVCVIGDERLASALIDALRASPDGARIRVRQPFDLNSIPQCHVGFIAAPQTRRTEAIIDAVRRRPILTVSDAPGFAQAGGMIELFVEDGSLRFAVNIDAAQQAQVRLSSRLLGLAKIVHGDHAQ